MKTLHLSIIVGIGVAMLVIGNSHLSFAQIDLGGPRTYGVPYIPDSPLKQIKSGIASKDVTCGKGFWLIFKTSDGSPACVKPDTAIVLVKHRWATNIPQPNPMTGLNNDTGIATLGNHTYYFMTPPYNETAYVPPTQISFHDVTFTLFPSGYRGGGLPAWGCGGIYYATDAKFSDNTSELLQIFVGSQDCHLPQPSTHFSNHANPQAGLTFYDGKMKLLVSMDYRAQQNNSIISSRTQTNETIYHDFPPAPEYSIVGYTQGITVNSDDEASRLTGFDVKSPTYLPPGYEVKLIKASKEIPMVTIFASKFPLTDKTTGEDFLWNQKGILISYQEVSPFELENYKKVWANSKNKVVTINGVPATIFDISKEYHDGYQYDMWGSLLAIKDNTTNIAIRGFFNSDDFIKMATSMLEK